MKTFLRYLVLGILLLVPGLWASAQVTSSNIAGFVHDDSTKAMPGAVVRAIHEPSGTTYGTSANADGTYNIQNLRVGGPYRIEVSYVGYINKTFRDIYLNLGETYQLNVTLNESENVSLQDVIVTGGRNPLLNNQRTGATTNVGVTQLQTLPTVSRSLTDFTRLSPQSGPSFSSNLNNGNTFGGRDGRYNNVQINGANFNNAFGLNSNLLPGGSAQPISLDAIEEIQIGIAPFDVRQGDFTGANVNAVTRSGTNTFTGSAYTYLRNQNFTGVHVAETDLPPQASTTNHIYGARIGGPIIKNKLFFFVNGEYEKYVYPGVTWIASRPGVTGPNVSRASAAQLDSVAIRLRALGYDPGAYENYGNNFTNKNTKFLARVDYNISDKHKLYVSYSQLNATEDNPVNATSAAGSRVTNNRIGSNALTFANSNYGIDHIVQSATAELTSTFSSKLSNQFLATFSNIRDQRTSPGSPFPFIDIVTGGTPALRNDNIISAGYELFTYQNDLKNKNLNILNNLTYNLGRHSLTGGLQYEYMTFGNSYLPYGTGYYRYASVSDFVNDRTPIVFGYTYPYAEQGGNSFVKVNYGEGSAYVQDRFSLNNRLTLTGGVRLELPFYMNKLLSNQYIDTLNLPDENGRITNYDVSKWPGSRLLASPRIAFNWDAFGDRRLQVRGGTGVFTGRIPFVWFTNQPGNTGTLTNQVVLASNVNADTAILNRMRFNPDPAAVAAANPSRFPQQGGTGVPGTIALVSPDLRMPQIWRSDLAVDAKLPLGLIGTAEAIYTRDLRNVYMRNANLPDAQASMADGENTRPYWTRNRIYNNITGVYVLENTNKGESFVFSIGVARPMRKGFYGSLYYTATYAKDISSNPGSQPGSVWNGLPNTSSPNDIVLGPSQYLTPHRVVGNISYRFEYAKHFATTASLYYEGASLGRFSYTYNTDLNNDGVNADLIYIPNNANELTFTDIKASNGAVLFTAAQQVDAFNAYMDQDKYLSRHKGGYAERYGAKYPFYSRFDLKLLQDVFTDLGKRRGTLQISMDMMNAGNFINPNWGVQQALTVGSANTSSILKPTVNSTTRTATYQMETVLDNNGRTVLPTSSFKDFYNTASTWYMQLGLRLIF
jgi:hypothetical protein